MENLNGGEGDRTDKPRKCQGRYDCKNEATKEIHECPYQADVNNDPSDHCYCCEACQHECAMDI